MNISEHYHRIDDSKNHFCRRRGVSLIFCFAFISLIFGIVVIFKSEFLTLFGKYNDNDSKQILFERYENNWQTLEQVDKQHIPKNWEWDSSCDSSHYFDLTFAIAIQNTDSLVLHIMTTIIQYSFFAHNGWCMYDIYDIYDIYT